MNLEHHVTAFNLSCKLKEMGVPQDSVYFWKKRYRQDEWTLAYIDNAKSGDPTCSAFLASELMAYLPRGTEVWSNGQDGFRAQYANANHSAGSRTVPDALAKLLIHLIEQGIVDPKTL